MQLFKNDAQMQLLHQQGVKVVGFVNKDIKL